MIHYIVGRNLGHLNRCVANLSKFRSISQATVKLHAFPHTHAWLRANLPKVKLRSLDRKTMKKKQLLLSGLVMHDWREEMQRLKLLREMNRPILGGIYHSYLTVTEHDTDWTRKFKQQILEISQKTTDIFFHINLTQPKEIPNLTTRYVPIPLIARDLTMQPSEVKQRLGIPPNEPFVLIQMGGGVGKYRYKYIDEWYQTVNRLKTPYRIVVANQLGGVDFTFDKRIIQAPLFDNGRDLVNAALLVISKPGMGILMDSIATGTPLLALPADTKEREVKNVMLRELMNSDICLAPNSFSPRDLAKRIEEVHQHAAKFREAFQRIPQNGAEIVAASMNLLSGHKLEDLPELHQQILKLTPFQI